jgi:hypothetical protein
MSLPSAWVDRVHARLLVRYGAAWIRKWEGVPMEAVKADWAETLGGLGREAILHALDHLPVDGPPNALQFRDLCRVGPQKTPEFDGFLQRLGVKPDPERVKRELEKLKTWRASMEQRMRDEPPAVAEEYRRTEGFAGPFTPPPEHTLPPGMRKERP